MKFVDPRPRLLLGHLPAFRRDPLGFLMHQAATAGPVAELSFAGRRVLLLNDPALIEQVLLRNSAQFAKTSSPRDVGGVFGRGLFTSTGGHWRRHRALLQPAFTPRAMDEYLTPMLDHTWGMLARWPDRGIIDLATEMRSLALRTLADALFSTSIESRAASIAAAMSVVIRRFKDEFPLPGSFSAILPSWAPTPANFRLRTAIHSLDAVVRDMIAERCQRGSMRDDLLALLLRMHKSATPATSERDLRDHIVTFLLTGHETTAAALSFMAWLLARYPAVQESMHAEVKQKLGGRRPRPDDLAHLTFTQQIVRETLRLYCPAWGLNRVATAQAELGGVAVRPGDAVAMSQWAMHRDRRWFADPEAFVPERWNGDRHAIPRFAYFPFGGGPRVCIGRAFALQQMTLMAATLAQGARLDQVPEAPLELNVSITVTPGGQLPVHVTRRP